MPEVIRGSRSHDSAPVSPLTQTHSHPTSPFTSVERALENTSDNTPYRKSVSDTLRPSVDERRRKSSSWRRAERDAIVKAEADAYYDSRAATKREFRRRGTTLQDYYRENPRLLPQLPFTWHHGWRRVRLGGLIFLMFVDACVLPIVLYYAMTFAGNVQSWITFAIVTTIWGGPTYLEFAVRSLRLIKKERFYRPLGTNSRWCFDLTTYVSVITITAVTALFVVGSAPHDAWIRVLSMPAPAILYALGGSIFIITMYNVAGLKAPFRISSTAKGEPVKPGVYYLIEDVVAVNAGAGRPYREALAARYDASPRFRRMIYIQSLFWSIPTIILAIPLTVIAVIHPVPAEIAYGICKLLAHLL